MNTVEPCFVIAEAGVNHNGCEKKALEMVSVAAAAGADAIKFQTFKAEKLVNRALQRAEYQESHMGIGSQFEMLKKLELSDGAHRRIAEFCAERDIEFLSTPFDEESANFLIDLGCRRLKVPSGEVTNLPFIKFLASTGLPIICSTGMASLDEVARLVECILEARKYATFSNSMAETLTLLHCTSNYPTALQNVNLRAMETLAVVFKVPVGYSDHTAGILVAPLARALGASVIEKHFTLDRNLPGPDHFSSLEPAELEAMICAIRDTDTLLGSPEKRPCAEELEMRIFARRSVTLSKDVPQGSLITMGMLTVLRPGNGISPGDMGKVVGAKLKRSMRKGDTLNWDDLTS